jgi:phage repressor protein C with HTH and peptisase S24 domain
VEKDPNHARFLGLLALARQKFGNDSGVAAALNVKPAHISQWKNAKHRVPPHTVELLSQLVHEPGKYPEPKTDGIIVDERAERGKLKQAAREIINTVTAPIIAFARGGEGSYPEDLGNDVPRIPVPCRDPNCYVLELTGDSMEPIYMEGDLLVVAPNEQPMNNDLVVVRTTDDEVLFKKFKHPKKGNEEGFQFQSFNPHHPLIILRPDQIYRISVVDCVIRPLKRRLRAMTVDPLSKMR